MKISIYDELESQVRSYCRSFPVVFARAKGTYIFTDSGDRYIDFLSGCGTLNYGHNNDYIKSRIIEYIESDSVIHAMDMLTCAKAYFLERFRDLILRPGGYTYKVQFPGPTGTNAVEAALKLARMVTGRSRVLSFTGAFHGMTLGALSVSSNPRFRASAGTELRDVTFFPYPDNATDPANSLSRLKDEIEGADPGEKPACVILETIQAEGGVNTAPTPWLRGLADVCRSSGVLLVCDDIQVGCGRTGPFFSFECAGIDPDVVVLAKAIGGYGLPLSLVLIRPELDVWDPGEHNGTFRSNQLGLIAAAAALEYREQFKLRDQVQRNATYMERFLHDEVRPIHDGIAIRGRGQIWGIDLRNIRDPDLAGCVLDRSFEMGLILETAGHDGNVLKLLPPLSITPSELEEGCAVVKASLDACMSEGISTVRQSNVTP